VQPVDGLGAGPAQLVAPVGEHAQHLQVRIEANLHQVRGAQRDHRHRMRVDRVGLAAVAGGEHPHLSRQLRRHVQHHLAVVHQPVGDVLANAVAAPHRPDPLGAAPAGGAHGGVAGRVGGVPARREHPAAVVDDLDRRRAFVRVHPDDHPQRRLPCRDRLGCPHAGHRYFKQDKPLSSLSLPGTRRDRRPEQSHTKDTGGQPQTGSV
jgi:hypothetical protein